MTASIAVLVLSPVKKNSYKSEGKGKGGENGTRYKKLTDPHVKNGENY